MAGYPRNELTMTGRPAAACHCTGDCMRTGTCPAQRTIRLPYGTTTAPASTSKPATELVDCAACTGTGVCKRYGDGGFMVCPGCNGAGKQRV